MTTHLFPLNRRRRLRTHVIRHPVDAAHFINNPAGYLFKQGVGQFGPVGGHEVAGLDGAQGDDVVVGAAIAHDAY